MKRIGLGLLAALAIACGMVPTSPTPGGDTAALLQMQDAKGGSDFRKVTLYFYSDDDSLGGQVHLVGLVVRLSWAGGSAVEQTSRQGSVSVNVPRHVTAVDFRTDPFGDFCSASGSVELPYGVRGNWILVHSDPTNCP